MSCVLNVVYITNYLTTYDFTWSQNHICPVTQLNPHLWCDGVFCCIFCVCVHVLYVHIHRICSSCQFNINMLPNMSSDSPNPHLWWGGVFCCIFCVCLHIDVELASYWASSTALTSLGFSFGPWTFFSCNKGPLTAMFCNPVKLMLC